MPDPEAARTSGVTVKAGSHIRLNLLLPALLLPLFFIVAFPLSYVSSLHEPVPRHVQLTVVGPDQVVAPITATLTATGDYVVNQTDVAPVARASVEHRDADGALLVTVRSAAPGGDTGEPAATAATTAPAIDVTTYVASGGGARLAAVIEALGTSVAKELGATSQVVDVAPLSSGDPIGIDLFYFFIVSSMGGYLVIIALVQVAPGTRLTVRWAISAATAIVAPLIVYGLQSIFDGDLGADLWTTVSLLGIASIYVLACSGTAIVLTQLFGRRATFAVMAIIVFLNFPSAGGALPNALLPAFWRGLHSFYFGAGAMESFRSLVYFNGNGLMNWLPQLLIWTGVAVILTVVLELARTVLQQRRELATLRADASGTGSRQPPGVQRPTATTPAVTDAEAAHQPSPLRQLAAAAPATEADA